MRYKNIAGRFFGLVTNQACDRRTDGQNYDSQDRASIAASRGKNASASVLRDLVPRPPTGALPLESLDPIFSNI